MTTKNTPPGGSRPFSQGGHWDNWNGSGDLDGKKGGEGETGGEEAKRRLGRIEDPNKPNKPRQTPNTPVTDKKRGPTALGRTLVDKEVGEGSGGRGGHVKDEQEGGEVRDLDEEERLPALTKIQSPGGSAGRSRSSFLRHTSTCRCCCGLLLPLLM